MLSHYWIPIQHGSEILGSEVRNGLYEVKFMVVHAPHIAHVLTKSTSLMETKSSTFHPQTDGQSERTIQILEDMLRARVLDLKGSWEEHCP